MCMCARVYACMCGLKTMQVLCGLKTMPSCVYIYLHIYIYIYVHIHIHIHVYMYTCMHEWMCVFMYIDLYLYIHIHAHTYVYHEHTIKPCLHTSYLSEPGNGITARTDHCWCRDEIYCYGS